MTPSLGANKISRIGYGAMRLPGIRDVPENSELAHNLLREAVSLGANVIDTAYFYGDGLANRLIAKALKPYSGNLIISTKVGVKAGAGGRPQAAATHEEIRASVERNLESLGVTSLELVFLRLAGGPLADSGIPVQESMECLAALQASGVVKHIGLSSASVAQIEAAETVTSVAAVQNSYFAGGGESSDVLDLCTAKEIPFFAYFPLGMGKLIQKKVDLGPFAASHKVSESQIALAWLLALSPIIVPIPGTSNIEHLRENMEALNIELSPSEVESLANVN